MAPIALTAILESHLGITFLIKKWATFSWILILVAQIVKDVKKYYFEWYIAFLIKELIFCLHYFY